MNQAAAVWLVIVLALVSANLPFVSERWFFLRFSGKQGKPFYVRLIELLLLYFFVGGVALLLEKRLGQIAEQGWELYAITACLFLTLAFPGFVYRYLARRSSHVIGAD